VIGTGTTGMKAGMGLRSDDEGSEMVGELLARGCYELPVRRR